MSYKCIAVSYCEDDIFQKNRGYDCSHPYNGMVDILYDKVNNEWITVDVNDTDFMFILNISDEDINGSYLDMLKEIIEKGA